MLRFIKNKQHLYILGFILIVGIFFRTYQVINQFNFDHDGDLYSWIVKDITVNHHFRLIGQLTTAPGIFIGPLFYYLITPFFLINNMYPTGGIIPITIIGILTIISYYFVFTKLFNTKIGLIAAFLYSVLLSTVRFDRQVVPSTLTNIWVIWYFYTVINITRGNYSVLPILGILIGLIWHIHIALIPALIAVPVAILVSHKLPTKKQAGLFLISLFITSLPLIIFEVRHNFQQTSSLFNNFMVKSDGATGIHKLQQVLEMVTKNINTLFFMPQSFKITNHFIFIILILFSALFLVKKKLLSIKELIVLYAWIIGVIVFFSMSSSPISEYYFANIEIIFIALVSLYLFVLFKSSSLGKIAVMSLLVLIVFKNGYFTVTKYFYHKGYLEKKAVVGFIKKDMQKKGFPCIGISYITAPGENAGFRYLLYLENIHLVHPSLEVPVYNIFVPEELSQDSNKQKYEHIAVVPPTYIPSTEAIQKSCQVPNTNLTDSMFGYVE